MPPEAPLLYEDVATHVASLIERGALRAGDRLPSVRRFARERDVSVATVLAAYRQLENRELIETRPKSGHFVRARAQLAPALRRPKPIAPAPAKVTVSDGVATLVASMRDSSVVPLGAAHLHPELYPIRAINRLLAGIVRDTATAGAAYEVSPGLLTLRRQLARRSLMWGMSLGEDDFVITSGAMEAMHLALRVTLRPGDSVAVSSPTYFGILHLIEDMGLRAVEIPSHPDRGMDIDALQLALRRTKIRGVVAIPNFDNPSGALMPYESRVRLAGLLERHDIPLIEDDIYGDLAWDNSRPSPIKALDRAGRVLLCGSTSKTIAAGYRVGWIVPGRYAERVERLKFSQSVATSTLEQMAIAEYLSSGAYDRHLRTLRSKLATQVRAFREAIAASFPAGTSVSNPSGGFLLWVELPSSIDALQLQAEAGRRGIAIAPGPIFAAGNRYKSCIRINCGFPWSPAISNAVRTLGELATRLAKNGGSHG
jgi:DNA-binding transcriptional MocR family regulator